MMPTQGSVFIMSGYRHTADADGDHREILTNVFATRELAAMVVMELFKDMFPDKADEFNIQNCMNGNSMHCGEWAEMYISVREFKF